MTTLEVLKQNLPDAVIVACDCGSRDACVKQIYREIWDIGAHTGQTPNKTLTEIYSKLESDGVYYAHDFDITKVFTITDNILTAITVSQSTEKVTPFIEMMRLEHRKNEYNKKYLHICERLQNLKNEYSKSI